VAVVLFAGDLASNLVAGPETEAFVANYRPYRRVLLNVVKNRNGERSRIELAFFLAVSRFRELGKQALLEE